VVTALEGKIALVTGAAGKQGFGRAIAGRLAREGANVVVADKYTILSRDKELHPDWRGLEAVVGEVQSLGRHALAITCDITRSSEVDKMVEQIVDKFGQIDILVNKAGVHIFGTIDSISDEVWEANLSVNLTGTFFCSRAVAREMMRRGQGGKIVNISSIFGKIGVGGGNTAYCVSKFGVVGLTQSLAVELAPYNITVNAVCPGLSDTEYAIEHFREQAQEENITAEEVKEQLFRSRIASIPLGRLTLPEDVADMVAFLVSKESDLITGQSINVNGGELMAH
jgi:NAD(P)-dependent dehydrogenase (short-subunit alcohol dehydrogenase family)